MDTPGTNSVKFRKINRKSILNALRGAESLSVADLSRSTGLSIATCANTLSEMVEYGEALVLEEKKSQGGRPARHFAFNPDQFLVAALLLKVADGKESLTYFVANAVGDVVDSGACEKSTVTLIEIEALISRLAARHPRLRSVAVSVPGIVKNGVIDMCDIPSLTDIALESHIRTTFGLEAVADNDTNFAAVGYCKACENRNISGLAYILFPGHSCIGAGIIVNGRLVRGRANFAGELSYIPLDGFGKGEPRSRQTPERLIQYAAKTSVAVIAVVDPDIIVLSGKGMTDQMRDAVRSACLEHIPAKHLPEIVIRPEIDADSLVGMIATAAEAYLQFSIDQQGDA